MCWFSEIQIAFIIYITLSWMRSNSIFGTIILFIFLLDFRILFILGILSTSFPLWVFFMLFFGWCPFSKFFHLELWAFRLILRLKRRLLMSYIQLYLLRIRYNINLLIYYMILIKCGFFSLYFTNWGGTHCIFVTFTSR